MILLSHKTDPVLPGSDDGRYDANRKASAFKRVALLDMRLQISDVPPRFSRYARAAGKTRFKQGLAQGATTGAVARGVDFRFGHAADVGSAAEHMAEMSFLITPGSDFDGASPGRLGIDDAGRFECIDNP
jgi:hypothetical protein